MAARWGVAPGGGRRVCHGAPATVRTSGPRFRHRLGGGRCGSHGPAGHGRGPGGDAEPESSGSYRAFGGRLQGCPPRGLRPRRWRCGCRARTARRSRRRGSTRGVATRFAVGPPARVHRRDEPDASARRRSCRPSFAVAFKHRLAHRAQGKACVPLQPVQMPFEARDRRQVHRGPRVPVQSRREDRQPAHSVPAARPSAPVPVQRFGRRVHGRWAVPSYVLAVRWRAPRTTGQARSRRPGAEPAPASGPR